MRLVIATPFLETKGGVDRVILKIASHFKARIHCINYNPETTFPEFSDLEIEVAKPGLLRKMPLGSRVKSAVEAGYHFYNTKIEDYDLINAHQTPSEWIRNKNKNVLWYCYSPNREAFDLYEWRMKRRSLPSKAVFWSSIAAFKVIEHQVVPNVEYIFTSCKNPQERIKRYLNRESEVLYPGVEYEKFSCKSYDQFFFYPSRITPEKEIEYAIKAFKRFSSNNKGWKLVIAGSISTRREHQQYLKYLQSLCDDSISIELNISDERLLDLYSRCFATLYSPVNEDYGLIPLESMAASKPCIARDEGGPKETIIDRVDGFLVSDIEDMAQKMQLLVKDPELCANMGRAGRKKVEQKFSWDIFLNRFEAQAKKMINENQK